MVTEESLSEAVGCLSDTVGLSAFDCEGSTLELSADGPLREPFVAFSQGCTHWTHWDLVLDEALRAMDADAGLQVTGAARR